MRVDYDSEVQAWYVTLSEAAVANTVHVSDEVAVDVDEAGEVVGVEFLLAPATIESAVRDALFERFPVVQKALAELHAAVASAERNRTMGVVGRLDLGVDFHRVDSAGLTHAHIDDATAGAHVEQGGFIVVGDDGADPGVAEVVEARSDGVVLLRVLPGHAELHRELLQPRTA